MEAAINHVVVVFCFSRGKNVATVVGVPWFSRFFLDGVLLVRRENIHNPNSADDHLISWVVLFMFFYLPVKHSLKSTKQKSGSSIILNRSSPNIDSSTGLWNHDLSTSQTAGRARPEVQRALQNKFRASKATRAPDLRSLDTSPLHPYLTWTKNCHHLG